MINLYDATYKIQRCERCGDELPEGSHWARRFCANCQKWKQSNAPMRVCARKLAREKLLCPNCLEKINLAYFDVPHNISEPEEESCKDC